MLDDVMKTIVNEKLSELNTTMHCKIISLSPLSVQPIPAKQYIGGAVDYPVIQGAKKLKEWALNHDGGVVPISMQLQINDVVLVAFGKKDLTDAVILGVLE